MIDRHKRYITRVTMDYINTDEIKKNLKCSDLQAAQLAEKQREEHIEKMNEFCFETVLSTGRNLPRLCEQWERVMEQCHSAKCFDDKVKQML